MPDDLSGKVILVTGAGRGIGRATALAFASEGARVVLAGRTRKQIKAVRDEIKVQGRTALAVSADVSKPRDVKALMRAALDKYGGIDLLVNNAGVLEPIAPIWSARPKDWRNNISINLIGLYSCAREVMRHMMQHSGGAIINVSSGAARNPRYGWSAYCTAKAAVDQLTRCMATELKDYHIRVNAVYPGITETHMQELIRASDDTQMGGGAEFFRQRYERGENLPAELPARLIVWLSRQTDINGQILDINDPEVRQRAGLLP